MQPNELATRIYLQNKRLYLCIEGDVTKLPSLYILGFFLSFRSLLIIFKVKGFMGLWWLSTHPLIRTPWPKLWGSLATNTCCIDTCMKNWNPSPSLTGTINDKEKLFTVVIRYLLFDLLKCFLSLNSKTHFLLELFNQLVYLIIKFCLIKTN